MEAIEPRLLMAASLVTVNAAGTAAAGGFPGAEDPARGVVTFLDAAFSPDGRYLLFHSNAPNLVSGVTDNNNADDLFLRDLQTNTTAIISVNKNNTAIGAENVGKVQFTSTSDFLIFASGTDDLLQGVTDNNGTTDVFVRNLSSGATSILTASTAGVATGFIASTAGLVVSPDGKYVAFEANSPNAVAGITDTNNGPDLYLRDLQAGTTTLVSVAASGGAAGNAQTTVSTPSFSPDSKKLLFRSNASNLVSGQTDTNNDADIFVRDLQANTTTLVSATPGSPTTTSNSGSVSPLWSPDGNSVVFSSLATDLVSGPSDSGGFDIFLRNLQTNTTQLISVNSTGNATGGASRGQFSSTGRYVKFLTTAIGVVAGTTDGNGAADVFVRDLQTNETLPISFDAGGNAVGTFTVQGRTQPTELLFSPNDQFAIFVSSAGGMVSGATDSNGKNDLFLMDMTTRGKSILTADSTNTAKGLSTAATFNEFSPDGRYISFTADDMGNVNGVTDNNFFPDVYVHDLQAGNNIAVSVNAAGNATGDSSSQDSIWSPDSHTLFFASSSSNLAPGVSDQNGLSDIYTRDLSTNATTLVTNNASGVGVGAGGLDPGKPYYVSKDGAKVAFASTATNLVTKYHDANNAADVFVAPSTGPGGVDDGGNGSGGGTGVDFTVGEVTNVKPGSFVGGAKGGSARTTIQNVGDTDFKGTLAVQFYASTDTSLDAGDVAISPTVNKKLTLKHGGKPAKIALKFAYPTVASGGDYYILAMADSADAIAEGSEGNNVGATASTINIAPPFVDLTGSSVMNKDTARHGIPTTVTVAVHNSGNTAVTRTRVEFVLVASLDNSLDTTQDNIPIFQGTALVTVKPNGTKNVKIRPSFQQVPSGTFNIIAIIDSSSIVSETNEGNNSIVSLTPITLT
jgi:hypothetical protein